MHWIIEHYPIRSCIIFYPNMEQCCSRDVVCHHLVNSSVSTHLHRLICIILWTIIRWLEPNERYFFAESGAVEIWTLSTFKNNGVDQTYIVFLNSIKQQKETKNELQRSFGFLKPFGFVSLTLTAWHTNRLINTYQIIIMTMKFSSIIVNSINTTSFQSEDFIIIISFAFFN